MEFDVAICGASLAGCSSAILLARAGWRVALLDQASRANTYKVLCSHHIHLSATPTLHRLGLEPLLEQAGAIRNGMQAWTRWGWVRPQADPHGGWPTHGYNVRRQTLDPLLRAQAAATPGVTLLMGHKVEQLLWRGERVAGVQVRHDGELRDLSARLVVGADGRHSKIARLAGCRERVGANGRVGFFAYYDGVEFASPNDSLIWFREPEQGFAFPNEGGSAQLGCYPSRALAQCWQDNPVAHMEAWLRQLPDFPRFDPSRRSSALLSDQHLQNVSRERARPGLALIGDAAMVSDPLWGSGCTWALQSAGWLADHVHAALGSVGAIDTALSAYARHHRDQTRWHQLLIADFSRIRNFNPVERLMFSAAARDARTATHLHAYGSRALSVGEFLRPSALGRAALVNLRHAWQRPASATTPGATPAAPEVAGQAAEAAS